MFAVSEEKVKIDLHHPESKAELRISHAHMQTAYQGATC